jgi:hypothetical protein
LVKPSWFTSAQLESPIASDWNMLHCCTSSSFTTPSKLMSPGQAGCDASIALNSPLSRIEILFLHRRQWNSSPKQIRVGGIQHWNGYVLVDFIELGVGGLRTGIGRSIV